ncbi:MAG: NAD(P)-dependent oxidoreductase [Alphaproteobacteria bacterium]|nr:MAG: NAD(P)-dependent oxidoreductase [Alphaproteobacteria bacterium]
MAVIGVIAQGMMGAAVGRRLHESGAEVRTLLTGRSQASAERAKKAGMAAAANERELLSGADFFLSILPPGEAEALAQHLAPALKALDRKPVYVDCNAVSPQTAIRIGEIVAPTGADFVDGGIIGGPPRPGYSPTIYASGPTAGETAVLRDWGIDWRVIDGPIGAASALKMSYAGITKGTTAIASAMLLGAAPGSPRWRRSPTFSKRTRRRATSMPQSPVSTPISPRRNQKRNPALITPSAPSTACWARSNPLAPLAGSGSGRGGSTFSPPRAGPGVRGRAPGRNGPIPCRRGRPRR